jgi:hypothetical protein
MADGRYLALNVSFVATLAEHLRSLGNAPVLEICAGDGSLARSLSQTGIEVVATDRKPPAGARADVHTLAHSGALATYRPRVVLGSFVPADAGIDRQVLESSHVLHYLVLNARVGAEFGSSHLWSAAGWDRAPLEAVTRWMLCRHDVWLGSAVPPLLHGEAWLFSRHADMRGR